MPECWEETDQEGKKIKDEIFIFYFDEDKIKICK